MIRKVLQQGHSSLVVSLPAKWVKQNNVMKGQEISIEQEGLDLVISPVCRMKKDNVEIDISGLNRKLIEKYILVAYKKGFSEITIKYKNEMAYSLKKKENVSVFEIIEEKVRNLIGLELVSCEKNKCVLKEVAEVRKEELQNIIKHSMTLLNKFIVSTGERAKKGKLDFSEIDINENNIDKFITLALRIINIKGLTNDSLSIHDFVLSLEEISDELAYFFKLVSGKKVSKQFDFNYQRVVDAASLMQSVYFVFNKEKIMKIAELRRSFYDSLEKDKFSLEEKELLRVLASVFNKILNVVESKISLQMSG